MYSFEVSHSIARAIVFHLVNRKKKSVKLKDSDKVIKKEETTSDFIDYDGMGNFSRFPCNGK